jgi:hypothetical protein
VSKFHDTYAFVDTVQIIEICEVYWSNAISA